MISTERMKEIQASADRLAGLISKFDDKLTLVAEMRFSQLLDENARLKKIIAKEFNENDEFGSEFVYVGILKEENKKLRAVVEAAKNAMARSKEPIGLKAICEWGEADAYYKLEKILEELEKE